MSVDEALAERVRDCVSEATDGTFEEKRMFGGVAFLVSGHMAVAASREGGLLLRIDPADADRLLARDHVGPFQMRGRPVDGWLRVDPDGVGTRGQLQRWVAHGVAYAGQLPPSRRA